MKKNAFEQWADAYKKGNAAGVELMWPSETLIRLFKGNYVPGLSKNYQGKKVIDVGFGNANNLIFLGSLGLNLSGTEVTAGICRDAQERLQTIGYKTDLKIGTNHKIPFKDNSFDFWFLGTFFTTKYRGQYSKGTCGIPEGP